MSIIRMEETIIESMEGLSVFGSEKHDSVCLERGGKVHGKVGNRKVAFVKSDGRPTKKYSYQRGLHY